MKILCVLVITLFLCPSLMARSEIPTKFEPTNHGFNYVRRTAMIPMRDGVKLHTVILVPKGARNAPILLTRTPYDANKLTSHADSSDPGSVLTGYDNAADVIVEGGYIRVVQDVRKILEHPNYDAYWRDQAVDNSRKAAAQSAGDAGAQFVGPGRHLRRHCGVQGIEPKDTNNDKVFLVLGPWYHGQMIRDGSALGAIKFNSDTSLTFDAKFFVLSWTNTSKKAHQKLMSLRWSRLKRERTRGDVCPGGPRDAKPGAH